jgi:hypothetical protein
MIVKQENERKEMILSSGRQADSTLCCLRRSSPVRADACWNIQGLERDWASERALPSRLWTLAHTRGKARKRTEGARFPPPAFLSLLLSYLD